MLIVNKISFINSGEKILNNISFSVDKEHKILIGENGTGKTTLLEIVIGNLTPDSGKISLNGSFAYIPQEIKQLDKTGIEEIEDTFPIIKNIEKKLAKIEKAGNFTEEYGKLLSEYEEKGGYTYKQIIYSMMDRFHLREKTVAMRLRDMSGGERTKCLTIKALLSKRDLMIMDEPTNHHDDETIEILKKSL